MSGYLLDTNALSEPVRRKPNQSVIRWLVAMNETSLFVTIRAAALERVAVLL